jgi:hypothetical protein
MVVGWETKFEVLLAQSKNGKKIRRLLHREKPQIKPD